MNVIWKKPKFSMEIVLKIDRNWLQKNPNCQHNKQPGTTKVVQLQLAGVILSQKKKNRKWSRKEHNNRSKGTDHSDIRYQIDISFSESNLLKMVVHNLCSHLISRLCYYNGILTRLI